ncbi:MAG TPA: feruloyl-CoA synthase [Parafilimonas sp.]|nr:feruloyl-CoA synthase [Parafilimonas sp.]
MAHAKNTAGCHHVNTIRIDIQKQVRADGSIVMHSAIPLEPYPFRLTERLKHWATIIPEKIFIGRKNATGHWETLTYAETFAKVQNIAHALLNKKVLTERPVAILSENSIEHGLIALAALHVGIPYSAIAPAYSLRSRDFKRLQYIIDLLQPGLIFVNDAAKYQPALQAVAKDIEIVAVKNGLSNTSITSFDDLLKSPPPGDLGGVEAAFNAIQPGTIAKILFTSGSTDLPKGVINTHENISTNWQQITQTFPFLKDKDLEFIDWLPWNHTFGGNHNFGLALFNGGSLYIDDGNPTPEGLAVTIKNLKERNPTVYFNVPKGFEELLHYFRKDYALAKRFFSNLKMLFYAGAGMPQHVWDGWESLSVEITGKKILIGTGLGCTESCPSALFASEPGGFAGLLGVPVPGLELKLVRSGEKLEARYRGKNIFPGYWRQPELTAAVFDKEGFYCTGDALRFADETDANKGMLFDGRLAEDFKLNTGTWVRVGVLRSQVIAAGNGLIQDIVITGHDNDFIGAIVFPAIEYCKHLTGLKETADVIHHPLVTEKLQKVLEEIARESTGSATLVKRAILADFDLSMDKGEVSDKGTINQRSVIQNHPDIVEQLYAKTPAENIIEIKTGYTKQVF